jgi:quercetin dioxygenase-like cupin family protein
MDEQLSFPLGKFPAHLGLGASVVREPAFTGPEWYDTYIERHAGDGAEGRLVSLYTFTAPWPTWEMHPKGDELVICTAGQITLHQEIDGKVRKVTLNRGDAAINPPGVWHTADIDGSCTAVFITAGVGTEIRPR